MTKIRIPGEINIKAPSEHEVKRFEMLRPYVRQTGNEIRGPWHLGPRKLLDYLSVYIAEGKGVFTVDQKTFNVSSGDIIWIKPDTLHEMRGTSQTMHCMFIHFDLIYDPARSHWDAYIPEGTTDLSKYKKVLHPEFQDGLISEWSGKLKLNKRFYPDALFKKIHEEHRFTMPGENKIILLAALMTELIYELIKVTANPEKIHLYYNRMQEAAKSIIENPEQKIELKKLAKKAGLSESHFRRVFREVHKQSAFSMSIEAKIKKACELLAYTNENVSSISAKLGFENIHAFSRTFKREIGASPLNYRMTVQ